MKKSQLEVRLLDRSHIVFDSSLDGGIDQVLALGLWFGLNVQGKLYPLSCSISRHDLQAAAFCDLMARFYAAGEDVDRGEISGQNLIGMATHGPLAKNPPRMLAAALTKRAADGQLAYPRRVAKLNDTADPAVMIRNQIQTQTNRVVLAGPPVNLLDLLALPEIGGVVSRLVEFLVISGGQFAEGTPDPLIAPHVAGMRKLIAEWPSPIVFAGAEAGEAIRYPASSIAADYAWTPSHPIVDAYRAYAKMPYDASTQAMAAVLYATEPKANYFEVSEPGTVTILNDGSTRFAKSPDGKHRHLMIDPAQRQRILEIYTHATSVEIRPPKEEPPKAAKALDARISERGAAKPVLGFLLGVVASTLLISLPSHVAGQAPENFDQVVKPVLAVCAQCHNARLLTGGLDVTKLDSADSILARRETWERMVLRVRAGEMPPHGAARPSQQRLAAMIDVVQDFLKRADSGGARDPGRVTAHRLNRTEYSNTVRDLLGVSFRGDKYFPADDSGDGFDNIGELLTVSPLLMERYLAAAELLAGWAVSTAGPPGPLTFTHYNHDGNLALIDRSTAQVELRVDYAGEYTVRLGMAGERPGNAAPVTMGFWMDGKMLHSRMVETKVSDPSNPWPYKQEEIRVYLPPGDHIFRAGFINDPYVKTLDWSELYGGDHKNKFIDLMDFTGPYPSGAASESRKRILTCDPNSGRACVERILRTLARRAYRRTATDSEVDALLRFADFATSHGQTAEQGIQVAVQAMLVSPNFLFRMEQDPNPADASAHPISNFELASRLSYFLWSSMPDDQLLDLAESGQLRTPKVLHAQVDRMLADSKSSEFAANFAGQWLETRSLDSVSPDRKKFPKWTSELRDAMKMETALFFQYVLRENRPITDFLDADYTFLNETLADHYEIAGVVGQEFRRVNLSGLANRPQRGGVLSHAGVLTVSSYPNRTSPVLRGKYVLQNILGTPSPPPPPNIPRLDEAAVGVAASLREQLERHRKNPDCASCHARMDPLGFGLENYDAIGRWRASDGNFPVDSSGVLPDGRTFSTPAEMRRILIGQLPQVSRNVIEKMLTYALGRGMEPYDRPTLDHIQRRLAAAEYRFKDLIHQVVESLPFQSRRAERAPGGTPW